jgi:hypothetical protein
MLVTGEMWGSNERPKRIWSFICKYQMFAGKLRFVVSILVTPTETRTKESGRRRPPI